MPPSKRRSEVWNYFCVVDENLKKAECKICTNLMSFRTTVSNLKHHLRHKHVMAYENMSKEQKKKSGTATADTDEDSNESCKQTSAGVWSYFEREGGDRARCAVCRASVPNVQNLLTAHLKKQHPKLLTEAAEEETEIILKDEVDDDQEDMYTEVVYLEEEPKDNTEEKRRREKTKRNVVECKPIRRKYSPVRVSAETPKRRPKRRASMSSEEYLLKKPKTITSATNEDDYEIESFGKYITCLLKKLPRHVCRQLQMNIVNLIMSANLNEESHKTVEAVPITIQRLPFQAAPGTSFIMVNEKDETMQNVTLPNAPQISNVQNHITISASSDVPASTPL